MPWSTPMGCTIEGKRRTNARHAMMAVSASRETRRSRLTACDDGIVHKREHARVQLLHVPIERLRKLGQDSVASRGQCDRLQAILLRHGRTKLDGRTGEAAGEDEI